MGDPGLRPAAEEEFRAVNVDGAQRLSRPRTAGPWNWVSSASVYDPRVSRRRVREDHPIAAQLNAYGRSKAAGDRLAQAYGAVVLRPHAVYGPGDPHLLPRLRRGVRAGVLPLPGPDVRTSLTAVENLADACLAALGWPACPYNIADAADYSRDAAITELFAALGQRVRIAHVPMRMASVAANAAERRNRLACPASLPQQATPSTRWRTTWCSTCPRQRTRAGNPGGCSGLPRDIALNVTIQ